MKEKPDEQAEIQEFMHSDMRVAGWTVKDCCPLIW